MLSQARGSSPVPSRGPEGAEDSGRGFLSPLLFLSDLWFPSIGIKTPRSSEVTMGPGGGHTTMCTQFPGQASPIRGRVLCHVPRALGHLSQVLSSSTSPRGQRSQPLTLHLSCPRNPRSGFKGSAGAVRLGDTAEKVGHKYFIARAA